MTNSPLRRQRAMSTINERFMAVAYDKAMRAARRAFRGWPDSKREDAEAEFMGKVWGLFRLSSG
jgi:hypothetical protein